MQFSTKLEPIASKLDLAQQVGFEFAEFWITEAMLEDVDAILQVAQGRKMGYVIHFPNSGLLDGRALANAARLYRELSCQAMVIHEPMMRSCGSRLLGIDPDLRLCVENSMHRGDRLLNWAEQHDWLTLDVEHFWKFHLQDAPFSELLDRLRDFLDRYVVKIGHVHLPGYAPGHPEHRPAHHHAALACAVFDLLSERGYQHFIVSELDLPYQTERELRADVALFRDWTATAAASNH